jgi:flavorubredoxin
MVAKKIKEDIFSVGALHWDRRLFDELIPLPDGTTYNSYLIKGGNKIALLDTVDPTKTEVLLQNLQELKIEKIDYIIAHHAEQDHSGSLPKVLEKYQSAKVVTNPKCKDMLKDLLLLGDDKFITINDREVLDLGGKSLEFIYAPWVHWPETMFSYLKEDKILFTCDFLGSHLASSELYAHDEAKVYESAKRYYAEIMMPFRTSIRKHLEVIKGLEVNLAAPSHGPIYDRPQFILDAYRDWASDEVKNEVVVPYVSMHGSVAAAINYFIDNLQKKGIVVKPFNLTRTDIGELAMALVDAATIVIGSPTVLVGPHPAAFYAAYLAGALRPKTKYVSIIGSYGWGGKMMDMLKGMLPGLKVEIIDPILIKGYPKKEDFKLIDNLIESIYAKHKQLGIIK